MSVDMVPLVTEEEIEAAIIGLGFSGHAATNLNRAVSDRDLRTDMRSALMAFIKWASS